MTTGTTTGTRSTGHRHDRHCYWDHLQCGWVCRPRPAADAEPVDAAPGSGRSAALRAVRRSRQRE